KGHDKLVKLGDKIAAEPKSSKKLKRMRRLYAHQLIEMSKRVRRFSFSIAMRRRFMEAIEYVVKHIRDAEMELQRIERALENKRRKDIDELKKQQRALRKSIREVEHRYMASAVDIKRTHQTIITSEMEVEQAKREMVEAIIKILRTQRLMVQELGREPTHEELARRVDMPAWKVRKALKIAQQPISLETPIGDDGETTIASFIEDRRSANPAETAITN